MTTIEWKSKKLDELGFVGRGRSRNRPRNEPSLYGGIYPFFQTGDIKAAELYLRDYSQTYNEKGLAQSKLWESGTLCITIAANIAETAILGIDGCFPDSIVGFVANSEEADVRFVKYYIDIIKLQMQGISRGTTQDNLSLEKLLSFDFQTPSLPTQQKIASVLSIYDDLIENNTRRIQILEEMAQAIYRQWFVEFEYPGHEAVPLVDSGTELGEIPQGWEVKNLGEIAEVNAESISKGNAPEQINYVDISSVSTGKIDEIRLLDFADAPSRARRIVKHGDVIYATVRPNRKSFSLIIQPIPNLIVSTGFAVLTSIEVPFTFLYYAVTTEEFVEYLTNHAQGAAYPAVNAGDFKSAKFIIPTEDLLGKFNEVVRDMVESKHNLLLKNANLRTTRDLLLPRLVSGEVDVEGLEIS